MFKKAMRVSMVFAMGCSFSSIQPSFLSLICKPCKSQNKTIFEACATGDLESVRNFLTTGASPNRRNLYNNTLLNCAVEHNRLDVAELLLVLGARINSKIPVISSNDKPTPQITALFSAAQRGNLQMCQELLRKGAGINGVQGCSYEYTPLWAAIAGKHYQVAFLLANAGAANINQNEIKDKSCQYALDTFKSQYQVTKRQYTVCRDCYEIHETVQFHYCQ